MMNHVITTVLLVVCASTLCYSYGVPSSYGNVIRFSADLDNVHRGWKDIMKEIRTAKFGRAKGLLGGYSYKNCGDPSTDLLVLSNLTLGPDPLSFPGDLTVSFKGLIKETVDAPLSADVVLERKIGSEYIKIPCIGGIGSCHYDDLCDLLAGATCPPAFVKANIPCKCPFSKGSYTLPATTFEVDAAVFPPGDYRASAKLAFSNRKVACVALTVTVD